MNRKGLTKSNLAVKHQRNPTDFSLGNTIFNDHNLAYI